MGSLAKAWPVEALLMRAGGRTAGRVSFHRSGAELALADGRQLTLGYGHAQLGWAEAPGKPALLTLVAADGEVVRLYFPDRQVVTAPPEAWPEPLQARARTLGAARARAWLALPVIGLAGAALWFAGGWMVAGLVWLVPTSVEPPVGRVFADATAAGKLDEDAVLNRTVTRIGEALVAHAPGNPYPFRFRVVDMPIQNAFAFPGGEVLVTRGLLAQARSADEVAGVLGHEITHVLRRHTTKRLMQDLGLTAALAIALGDVGTLGGVAVGAGRELVGLAFGRDQESEADDNGVRLAHAAGFDPLGLSGFFSRMAADEQGAGSAILSSHPSSEDRLAKIAAEAQALGPPRKGERPPLPDWREVRAHAGGTLPAPTPTARPHGRAGV